MKPPTTKIDMLNAHKSDAIAIQNEELKIKYDSLNIEIYDGVGTNVVFLYNAMPVATIKFDADGLTAYTIHIDGTISRVINTKLD